MKLLGKDFSSQALLSRIESKLSARGLAFSPLSPVQFGSVEPRVDPLAFNLEALAEHAQAARPLPLETHRQGFGRGVLWAKRLFRATCQVLINETLGRQQLFNGHVRDAYAQLSAEMVDLKAQVATLTAQLAARAARPEGKPTQKTNPTRPAPNRSKQSASVSSRSASRKKA